MSEPATIGENTKVVLLLCGTFSAGIKPLLPAEYNQLAARLVQLGKQPVDLISAENTPLLEKLATRRVPAARLSALLARGFELGLKLEGWISQGVWVLSRADPLYPTLVSKRLKSAAPPLIYGLGDTSVFASEMRLGIVGSRDIDERAVRFTREIAARYARAGVTIVSGVARGVDSEAMLAALDAGGVAIGLPAEGVTRLVKKRDWRNGVASGRLVLATPYAPDARWTTGNAMGRNKLIYALSSAVLVVSSGLTGGTWSGATETIQKGWAPLLVRSGSAVPEGNTELLRQGGRPFEPDAEPVDYLSRIQEETRIPEDTQLDLFDNQRENKEHL